MKKTTSGFTIVELLIVIIVIAILASITVVAFNGVRARALDSEKGGRFNAIVKAIQNYKTLNDTFPSGLQGSAGAAKLGMTLADTEPTGYSVSQHGGVRGIDGGWNAGAGETGFIYLPIGQGGSCDETAVKCTYFRLAYWSQSKNQEVFIESGSYW